MTVFFTKEELNCIYETLHRYAESNEGIDTLTIRVKQEKVNRVIRYFIDRDSDKELDITKKELGILVEALQLLDPSNSDLRLRIFEAYKKSN